MCLNSFANFAIDKNILGYDGLTEGRSCTDFQLSDIDIEEENETETNEDKCATTNEGDGANQEPMDTMPEQVNETPVPRLSDSFHTDNDKTKWGMGTERTKQQTAHKVCMVRRPSPSCLAYMVLFIKIFFSVCVHTNYS